MPKVLVGMSGGVDSAVAAYLLKKEGYEVVGVSLRTQEAESRCCEIDDARESAMKIGIPFYPMNCIEDFEEKVERPFMDAYLSGKTPNPCVICNRCVKWDRLLYYAKVLDADFVATGHYAYVTLLENGRYTVKKGAYAGKDQSYMLYRLSQEQLEKTMMPLGSFSKDEVRAIAREAGLSVSEKPDSQEICFVADNDYAGYIEKHCGKDIPGEGDFVDEDGKVLGRHKGLIHYTVGQRKGLELAMGYPVYVKSIDPVRNEVVICRNEALFEKKVVCEDLNFLSIEGLERGEKLRCLAKVRYHHEAAPAYIQMTGDGRLLIEFDEPVRAAAPGQSAVFYDENGCIIGGGIISA
ncbi:MAG: tRNA 2-thiouridine(34) synthase MnmA [Firmicutes bacterium]|nr:tRNA 2-thiouridine(34) synthase MnmA [Bacillota bacterium]